MMKIIAICIACTGRRSKKMMKIIAIFIACTAAFAAADAGILYGHYGYSSLGYDYGLGYGRFAYGKRAADAEPLYGHYGYSSLGYGYGLGYGRFAYGKRAADAKLPYAHPALWGCGENINPCYFTSGYDSEPYYGYGSGYGGGYGPGNVGFGGYGGVSFYG